MVRRAADVDRAGRGRKRTREEEPERLVVADVQKYCPTVIQVVKVCLLPGTQRKPSGLCLRAMSWAKVGSRRARRARREKALRRLLAGGRADTSGSSRAPLAGVLGLGKAGSSRRIRDPGRA